MNETKIQIALFVASKVITLPNPHIVPLPHNIINKSFKKFLTFLNVLVLIIILKQGGISWPPGDKKNPNFYNPLKKEKLFIHALIDVDACE
jgi:hypothetical protein